MPRRFNLCTIAFTMHLFVIGGVLLTVCPAQTQPKSQSKSRPSRSTLPSRGGGRQEATPPPVVPMIFPVLGKVSWSDTFGAPRGGGTRTHAGQDLMAPQMTPLVACFEGVISVGRDRNPNGHNILSLQGDNGWTAVYMHINNDTPGTDDEKGTDEYAYPPGLKSGDRVVAGQLIAFCGNSGNARYVGPHCHFELHGPNGVVNAVASLRAAKHITEPAVRRGEMEGKPQAGEIRLDGYVRSVDMGKRTCILDLCSWTLPNGKTIPMTSPTRRWVSLPDGMTITQRGDSTQKVEMGELLAGVSVTAIGPDRGKERAVIVRQMVVDRSAPTPRLETPRGEEEEVPPSPQESIPPPTTAIHGGLERRQRRGVDLVAQAAATRAEMEERVLDLLNDYRRRNRLPEVTLHPVLSAIARRHCEELADRSSHKESTLEDRVKASSYEADNVAGNVATGLFFAEDVVDGWMKQGRESRAVLGRRFREVGIAYFRPAGGGAIPQTRCYWVVVFATPSASHSN